MDLPAAPPPRHDDQITTSRLVIRPFEEGDIKEHYVDWLNDPEVVKYSEQRHGTHTLQSCREYLHSYRGSGNHFWAITMRSSPGTHIGNINAFIDPFNRVADVGIIIGAKTAWGDGFGTEAWTATCAYLLEACGMRKVSAGTMATNHGMIRIMEKSGMSHDGVRRRHFLWQGREVDLVNMALWNDQRYADSA